jgi:acyl-CoA dehydrogenase
LSKALCTDLANELTSMALQVHGGMGYVEETGVAQHYRDARIAAIYEGTNGIQAADLVGRKLAMRGGAVILELLDELGHPVADLAEDPRTESIASGLRWAIDTAQVATEALVAEAGVDQRAVLAASAPYLRLLGATVCAGLLAKGAAVARTVDDDFHRAKVISASFFVEQILPPILGLLPVVLAPADDLFALTPAQLA